MEPDDRSALVLGPSVRSLATVPNAPRLSAASATPLREIAAVDEAGAARALHLPVERPLTVVIDGRELVTLMTLGAAAEWLVLGYLVNQRLVDDVAALRAIEVDWKLGVAKVTSRSGHGGGKLGDASAAQSRGGASPSDASPSGASPFGCGLGTVFGDVMRQPGGEGHTSLLAPGMTAAAAKPPIAQAQILSILDTMRQHDAIHRAAGSVHSCALFKGSELWIAIEDVSRHNGVDTITGFMRLHGVEGGDKTLFTTGRLTGEMVMKAAHNGIYAMISRNGTTAVGHEIGTKLGMTLIGRAANRRYLCYVGAERIEAAPR